MKKIYLVRHGESLGNQQRIHQGGDSPLSEIGESQAKLVAHRFKNIQFEALLCSPYKRAQQTAQAISKATGHEIETINDLHEYDWPSEILGTSFDDTKAKAVREKLAKRSEDQDWKYSDEESFSELKTRMLGIYETLKSRPEKNIVVVFHGFVLNLLLGIMMIGEDITFDQAVKLFSSIAFSNTGITVLSQKTDRFSKQDEWKISTINDDAHLG